MNCKRKQIKRILSLLLMAVVCLGLSACGDKTPTKEEMLAVAAEFSANEIQNDSIDNIVSAKQKFCNTTISVSGYVRNIEEDHIELSAAYSSNYIVDVYLSTDELVKLERGQSITVVGTTTDEIIESSENVAEYTFDYNHYQMPVAYLVKDRVEITGILKGKNYSYKPAYNIKVGDSNVLGLIYFADGVDVSTLENGKEARFLVKAINNGNGLKYFDAEIIK